MEDTRLTQPVKLNTLLVITTLAMAWAYACATAIKGTKSIKTRAHGYRYKSSFRLGFDQLRRWILHQPERAARSGDGFGQSAKAPSKPPESCSASTAPYVLQLHDSYSRIDPLPHQI